MKKRNLNKNFKGFIDEERKVVNQGVDNHADADPASIAILKNDVSKALKELIDGKKIIVHTTKLYGYSTRY